MMGKINNFPVEIIPLDDTTTTTNSNDRSIQGNKSNSNNNDTLRDQVKGPKKAMHHRQTYLADSSIVPRVQKPDNSLNNQLMDMYGRVIGLKQSRVDENELIDISSDDSDDDQPFYNDKATNGPSTSSSKRNENNDSPSTFYPEQEDKNYPQGNDKMGGYKLPPNLNVIVDGRGKKRKLDGAISSSSMISKKKRSLSALQEPNVAFKDIGGMDPTLEEVCKLLVHIKHPEIYRQLGISPPRGFLLHGPPGSGKTLLANAIAGELGVPLLKVSAPELVAGVSGESEERIRELFERAIATSPCVLFIDEIDAITPNRQNAQKEMERRIVAQLLTCLDDLSQNETGDRVLVIGATNRPDSIDPALRRAGRFDREVSLGIPSLQSREEILRVLTNKLKLEENFDFSYLAKYTPGFVGADLMALTREAALVAVNRVFNEVKDKRKIEEDERVSKLPPLVAAPVVEMLPANSEDDKETQQSQPQEEKATEVVDIIVDDEPAKQQPEKKEAAAAIITPQQNSEPVVVIDDEIKQPAVSSEKSEENCIVDVTEQFEKSPLTPLEELITWLHEISPLTNEQLSELNITMEDFGKALKNVQPSAKREGFATVPDTTWDDVGSLREIREELQMAILAPVRHADQFKLLGMTASTGVLLCGPPGCGKTLLAKAVANEAGINFISVKGPELLNMYVGESERAVRTCFTRARNSAPCVIFFDEIDALCPKRSDSREGGATMRVVNQMLTEMDGIEGRQGVFLLAASNRPDIVDPAILRPGRLDKIFYVGLPSPTDRVDILRAITKNGAKPPLAPDVDLEFIGKSEKCNGYSGADLAALVREASVVSLKEFMICGNPQQQVVVTMDHFKTAVNKIKPSVSEKDQKYYDKLRKMYDVTLQESNEVEEMECL